MRKLLICLSILVTAPVLCHAAVASSKTVVNDSGLTYNNNYDTDINRFAGTQGAAAKLAVQVTYSSVTFAAKTFTDGTQSTGSLTVVSTAPLAAVQATNNITVPSTALILGAPATAQITISSFTGNFGSGSVARIVVGALSTTPASITLNGNQTITIVNGGDFTGTATATGTATSLAAGINVWTSVTGIRAAVEVNVSTVVVATATVNGTYGQRYSIGSSTPFLISTAAFAGGVSNAFITINGNVLTNQTQWTAQTTASGTASNIATAINTYLTSSLVAATTGWTTIYTTATTRGTAGNSYTLTSSTPTVITTTTFTGGLDRILQNDVITINGVPYLNGTSWTDASNTSTGTAATIATLLKNAGGIAATTNGVSSVIYATATAAGTAGNSLTLAASAGLTVASANFIGGQSSATITINGVVLRYGTDWTFGASTTTSTTASSIATAINANVILAPLITAQATGAVIVSTSDFVGLSTNFTTVSSTQSALSFANATMTGGTDAGYSITTDRITIPGHGFTKALPVLLSTGGATIGPLANQTTYYVVVIDSNTIGVSSTSAVAQVGNYIDLTSSSTQTTAHTLTLTPGTFIQGLTAAKWQVSNDGTNWADFSVTSANIAVSSQTFAAVFPSSTVVQDFGIIDYGYLRYNVVGPTQGAVNLKVIMNAKD